MPSKPSAFNAALEPSTDLLPASIAESVGRTIARHSYLEWVLGQVLYSLLEISIKQGRKVVQRPAPRAYVSAVQGLFAFHKLATTFDFADLARRLERADRARDALASSVYMRDVNSRALKLHLVRGSWAIDDDAEVSSRDAWPDTPILDRSTLARLRKDVEDGVARAEKLQSITDRLLRELHDRRRTNPAFNRRRKDRRG
jgi:hypothetical protein